MSIDGTIGIVSGEAGRYTRFAQSLLLTQRRGGTFVRWEMGANVAGNCNSLVRAMQGDWLWILGDDHSWEPDVLTRLLVHLDRPDVDMVVPRCLTKKPPYAPVIYKSRKADGTFETLYLKPGTTALTELYAAGTAGMLIKRRVFDGMDDPWFELGQITSAGMGEDLWFCHKAQQAGFRLWVDPTVSIGHLSVVEVWPSDAGVARFVMGNGVNFDLGYAPDAIHPSDR